MPASSLTWAICGTRLRKPGPLRATTIRLSNNSAVPHMHRRHFTKTVAGAIAGATFSGNPLAALGRRPLPPFDAARLNARIKELSVFGANPQGGVSRVAYGDADKAGRAYAMELMRDAGLEPHIDAAG